MIRKEPRTPMYNASLDRFLIQCDSMALEFQPRKATLVPDRLVAFAYEQVKNRGIFPIYPSMTAQDIKQAHRAALLEYLGGHLKERIVNYTAQEDEFRKKGITLRRSPAFDRALRWEKEIRAMLELEAPIEQELSFLEEEKRKELDLHVNGAEYVPPDENMFDPDKIVLNDERDIAEDEGARLDRVAAEVEEALSGGAIEPVELSPALPQPPPVKRKGRLSRAPQSFNDS